MNRRLTEVCLTALHILVLLVVVSVPCYAIGDALWALFRGGESESLGAIVDWRRWAILLGNTAVVCGVATLTAIVLGIVYGLLIARTDMPGRSVLLLFATLGACIPIYITMVFVTVYKPLTTFHGSAAACGLLYGLFYTPLATIVFTAAFRAVDRASEEQALLDASMSRVLWRVTLPQVRWAVAMFGMVVFLLVATDCTITDILQVRTFAEEVFTQFQLHRTCGGPLLTGMPVLLILAVSLAFVQRRYRLLGEHSPWQGGGQSLLVSLGKWRVLVAVIAFAVPAILVEEPARALLIRIGSWRTFFDETRGLFEELAHSTIISLAAGVAITFFAVGAAWFAIRGRRLRWLVGAVAVLLLATPSPVVGISLIGMLDRSVVRWLGLDWPGAIYDSPCILLIAYVTRFLPVAVLLLLPSVQRVALELEWSARVDGCNWPAMQWHVYWPAVKRQAAAACLIVVILCFSEIGATMLVVPGHWETASVRAFTLLHYGVYPDLAVLAVLSIGCILLPWSGLLLLFRK